MAHICLRDLQQQNCPLKIVALSLTILTVLSSWFRDSEDLKEVGTMNDSKTWPEFELLLQSQFRGAPAAESAQQAECAKVVVESAEVPLGGAEKEIAAEKGHASFRPELKDNKQFSFA
jgi:hypothetical protein